MEPGKESDLLLESFEKDESLKALNLEEVVLERSSDHATEGKSSLKALFDGTGACIIFRSGRAYRSVDWTGYGILALDIYNANRKNVKLEVSFFPVVRTSIAGLLDGFEVYTFKIEVSPETCQKIDIPFQEYIGMRGLPPLDGKFHPAGRAKASFLNLASIQSFAITLVAPNEPTMLYIDNLRLLPGMPLEGIIDRFGQYTGIDWPGKIHSRQDLRKQAVAEEKDLNSFQPSPDLDKYGGYKKGPKLGATGWFRTEKVEGKWWLVTPEGHIFWSIGFNSVSCEISGHSTIVKGREYMFKWLPSHDSPYNRFYVTPTWTQKEVETNGEKKTCFSFYPLNLMRKYGEDYPERWMLITEKRHKRWGVNTIGPWAERRVCEAGWAPFVTYIASLIKWAGMSLGTGIDAVLEDGFPEEIDRVIAEETAYWRDNPWLIGYFVGFELPWGRSDFDLPNLYMGAPRASPVKRALVKMLKERYEDNIERLNKAWKTAFKSFDDLYTNPPEKASDFSEAAAADMREFLRRVAERFFKCVAESLKRHDPNHLYLGCRFHVWPPVVFEECAKYADVVTVNIWRVRDILEHPMAPLWGSIDKPILILGFTMVTFDQGKWGRFHPSIGPVTSTQAERGEAYRRYVETAARHPLFVGTHYFAYVDQPSTGRYIDGENFINGFVTITDTPYEEFVDIAMEVNQRIYETRLQSR